MITVPKQAKHGMNKTRYTPIVNANVQHYKKLQKIVAVHHLQNIASVTSSYMGMSIDLKKHQLARHIEF